VLFRSIIFIALLTGYISKDHTGSWWIIIMTSTFSGIFNGLAMPARQAMIVEIVDREHIMNATSLSSMGQNICSLAGPSVAGFLIGSRMDYKVVYATMVGLYLMAIILTNFLPAISAVPTRSRNTFNDIKEGLKYVRSNSLILMIIIFNLCCILMAAPRIQLMPIFATDILKVGAAGQGVLQSVGAAGSLIASAVYASLPSKKRGLLMLLAGLSLGLTLTVFAFSTSYPLSIAMMLLVGIGQTGHMVMGNIFLQTLSDKEYVGRVMSVLMMCMSLSNLMIFFVGIYTEFVGARWAIGSLSMALVLIASASLIFLPRIRKLD
jgi:MFS family permease